MLVACNNELGIITQGKDWDSLMENIRDVIETYYNIPSADIARIILDIEPLLDNEESTL
jgi:predicted RNase H-like HicB family nuclease